MSQNLPERFSVSPHPITISYLRAWTIETTSLPNDSMRPLFMQFENFSGLPTVYFNCKYFPYYTRKLPPCFAFWACVRLGRFRLELHHGVVLGDAVVCQVLAFETRNAIYITMGKFSCCVPGRTNNWRNSPNMKFHTSPTELKVKKTSYD